MKRTVAFTAALLAAFAFVAPAFADEPPPPRKRARAAPARVAPPPPEPEPVRQASNWSGGQIGSSNGGSFSNNAFAEPGSYICPPGSTFGKNCLETPFSFDERDGSFTTGGFLGYNIQLGAIVIGVEGDLMYKDTETSVTQRTKTQINLPYLGVVNSDIDISPRYFLREDRFTGTLDQGWDGSVRGRIGFLVMPSVLVYGTGGVAFGEVSGTLNYVGEVFECNFPGRGCSFGFQGRATSSTSFRETRTGYTAGGGVEMQLLGPWNGRIEYRYTDLGTFTKAFPVNTDCPSCVSPSPGATIELNPTFHTVRFGLGIGLGNLFGLLGL